MKKNNSLVPFHRFFNSLADGILNVFLPVIIFTKTGNIWLAVGYIAVDFFVQAVANPILKKLIMRHSFISLCLHVIFIIACQTLIVFAGFSTIIVLIAAVCAGFSSALYYAPMYYNFACSCKNINSARLISAESIGKAVMILISSYLLHTDLEQHFVWALIASIILYIISLVPLASYTLNIKRHYESANKLSLWQYQKSFVRSTIFQNFLGIAHAVSRYLVPLYLIVEHRNLQAVGIVLAIAELSKIIGGYIAKFLVNKKHYNTAMVLASVIWGASCIGIIFTTNKIVDFVLATLLLFSLSMVFVANFGIFTRRIAFEGGLIPGLILREYHMNMSKLATVGLFALTASFPLILAVGAAASFGIYFFPYRHRYSPPQMPYNIFDENTGN